MVIGAIMSTTETCNAIDLPNLSQHPLRGNSRKHCQAFCNSNQQFSVNKFLHSITQSTLIMESSDESTARQAQFRDAVDRCDLTAAVKLCEKDWKVRTEGVAYVVKKKPLRFIINYIERIKHLSEQTLVALYRTGSKTAIEAVIEEVEFPKQYLLHAASTCTLMRSPENFINLLNKVAPGDHKYVVERGINRLFWNRRIRYIGPLLAALEGKTFQDESLKDIAIQRLFYSGIYGYDDDLVKAHL